MLIVDVSNELWQAVLLRQVKFLSIGSNRRFIATYKDAWGASLPNDTFLLSNHRCFLHDHLL